jgi:hypothetical protein
MSKAYKESKLAKKAMLEPIQQQFPGISSESGSQEDETEEDQHNIDDDNGSSDSSTGSPSG